MPFLLLVVVVISTLKIAKVLNIRNSKYCHNIYSHAYTRIYIHMNIHIHIHMYVCLLSLPVFVFVTVNASCTTCAWWQFGIPVWPITLERERERESGVASVAFYRCCDNWLFILHTHARTLTIKHERLALHSALFLLCKVIFLLSHFYWIFGLTFCGFCAALQQFWTSVHSWALFCCCAAFINRTFWYVLHVFEHTQNFICILCVWLSFRVACVCLLLFCFCGSAYLSIQRNFDRFGESGNAAFSASLSLSLSLPLIWHCYQCFLLP